MGPGEVIAIRFGYAFDIHHCDPADKWDLQWKISGIIYFIDLRGLGLVQPVCVKLQDKKDQLANYADGSVIELFCYLHADSGRR